MKTYIFYNIFIYIVAFIKKKKMKQNEKTETKE